MEIIETVYVNEIFFFISPLIINTSHYSLLHLLFLKNYRTNIGNIFSKNHCLWYVTIALKS